MATIMYVLHVFVIDMLNGLLVFDMLFDVN